MQVQLGNEAILKIDERTMRGTYSDSVYSAEVRLVSNEPDGIILERQSDGAQFQQRGEREVRLNYMTGDRFQPVSLGKSVRTSIPSIGWKNSFLQQGQARAIATDFRMGLGAGWVFKQTEVPAAPQNETQPWQLTGFYSVGPQASGQEVVLIDTVVPKGYRMRLKAHSQFLEEGSANEGFFIWKLRIGGMDILNPFTGIDNVAGRIVKSNNLLVDFSGDISELPVLAPGTKIQYIVRGGLNVPVNNDHISVSLIGTMWGDKGV